MGGLSIQTGVLFILLLVISVPIIFIPTFRPVKILVVAVVNLLVYGIAQYIEVTNKGLQNVVKKVFSRNVEAIKIKSLNIFKGTE